MTDKKLSCIFCGNEGIDCRCSFKKPTKAIRSYSHEIYTTAPRTYKEMLDEFQETFRVSAGNNRKCIFKLTVHAVKEP